MAKKSESSASSFNLAPWVLGALCVLGLSVAVLVFILYRVEEGHRGPTGDLWGGSLSWGVGGAGTILFLATLLMQRQELSLQRLELQKAMEIAEEQKNIALDQERHSATQVGIARRDSVRRSLAQLLEVRLAITTYNLQSTDGNMLKDRQARIFRLSRLVCHLLSSNDLDANEQNEWREAFGPWVSMKYEDNNYLCIKLPFKQPPINPPDLIEW